MIKEFVKSLEELLLVVSTKFSKERGVVGLLFLFNQASTDFVLAVVSRLVSLPLELPTKCSCFSVLLVQPWRVSVVVRGGFLIGSKLV